MISVLIHIGLGMVLSFVGSIPFGMINLTVVESAISRGFRNAFRVALGAAIIEFIQSIIALKFSDFITRNPMTEHILFWISIPVFIGLGIFYFRQKPKENPEMHGYSKGKGFLKGVIVSSLNVLAIPYWVFYGTSLAAIDLIDPASNLNILYFSLGVMSGTLTILVIYARLGVYAQKRFSKITNYIAPAVAYLFFGLGAIQVARLIWKFFM